MNNINNLDLQIKEALLNDEVKEAHYEYKKGLKPKIQNALELLNTEHNNGWAIEMYNRNKNNLDNIALFYRGAKITYREMFEKAFAYAKSLKKMGYQKEDEIPMCVSNIPEFIYLFLATSFIGARVNSFGEWFDEQYNIDILNNTKSKTVFISDDIYPLIKEKIEKSNIQNIVVLSLANSLPKNKEGQKEDIYKDFDNRHYKIVNKTEDIANETEKLVLDEEKFLAVGKHYKGKVITNTSLDDPFTITYTSGTTDPGKPKAVLQSNRSYITLSRFKESDVSGMPSMHNLSVLCHIPTYTHMELSCAISDTLYEGCTLDLEPFYDKDFFPYALLINKPNFVPAAVGFWNHLCSLLNFDDNFKHINLPFLMIPTITGEGASAGEEKFFNYTSRKHKFGTGKLPFPLAPVTFSIGGGTTESSGIFVTLYKALQEKRLDNVLKGNKLGLTPHRFAEVEVLDKNGNYCGINEPGLLVANSPCTMIKYLYNDKLNETTHVKDKTGKSWFSLGTYSYKSDKQGRIKMKGRLKDFIQLSDGTEYPLYKIEDAILLDTKNIMSCSVVSTMDNAKKVYVAHIEFQPITKQSEEKIMASVKQRLNDFVPTEVLNNLFIRIRSNEESFPLAPSGKRNTNELVLEGLINAKPYFKPKEEAKKLEKSK